jgi:NAD(P)H dehydrogenase (quinone)
MRTLIVHAHHEPTSFNASLTREGMAALERAGHEVIVSDLYAMGFDPVSDRRNFTSLLTPDVLRQQNEEAHASSTRGFTTDLQSEMDKLAWCDALVLQFPIWWLGMPAILKGWIDRVFAVGQAYGGGRWFDRGVLAGKLAMCSVTVGGPPELYGDEGLYPSIDEILLPIHRGIFGFTGLTVLEPFVIFGPGRITPAERTEYLDRYCARLLDLDGVPVIPQPHTSEFDGFVRRKPPNTIFKPVIKAADT